MSTKSLFEDQEDPFGGNDNNRRVAARRAKLNAPAAEATKPAEVEPKAVVVAPVAPVVPVPAATSTEAQQSAAAPVGAVATELGTSLAPPAPPMNAAQRRAAEKAAAKAAKAAAPPTWKP